MKMNAAIENKEAKFKLVHIEDITAGDIVFHEEKMRTVCRSDLRRHPDGELTLFGDSYRLGYKSVMIAIKGEIA
jgi:hypothetical protein